MKFPSRSFYFWGSLCEALILLMLLLWSWPSSIAGPDQIRKEHHSSEAVLLSREGEELQSLRLDTLGRRLDWIPLDSISPELKLTIIKLEDQRFYSHDGIDFAALFGNLSHPTQFRGASTLSMQVASLLNPGLGQGGHRSFLQKIRQMRHAWKIENFWTKNQILEAYLNLSTFRGEYQGIRAASQALFRKAPQSLDLGESYFLASLLRKPDDDLEHVQSRACKLYQLYEKQSQCTAVQGAANNLQKLKLSQVGLAPHAARFLLEHPGQSLRSSISRPIQEYVIHAMQRRLQELAGQRAEDASVVVLDNATGEVMAYVASSGVLSKSAFVDGIRAKRQAGSTLKPFLYEQALEQGLDASSLLDDSPMNFTSEMGIYSPQNYDHKFQGWVSVRRALASSMNIPTLRVLDRVGLSSFYDRLENLGFDLDQASDFYGPTLALGSAELSLWQLSQAYMCLARQGNCIQAHFELGHNQKGKQVMQEDAAFVISDILSDPTARAWGFGLDNVLNTPFWSAAKTGTSKGMRDNWCLGYSTRYTVGVWVGNFSGEEMGNVSGVSGAAPLWLDVMKFIHSTAIPTEPSIPAGVHQDAVRFSHGKEGPRLEYYLDGHHGGLSRPPRPRSQELLLSPNDGEIIALDPEIPEQSQKLMIRRQGSDSLHLYMNGRDLGTSSTVLWFPIPGKHLLQVVDSKQRVLDSASFLVKLPPARNP